MTIAKWILSNYTGPAHAISHISVILKRSRLTFSERDFLIDVAALIPRIYSGEDLGKEILKNAK